MCGPPFLDHVFGQLAVFLEFKNLSKQSWSQTTFSFRDFLDEGVVLLEFFIRQFCVLLKQRFFMGSWSGSESSVQPP